MQYIINNRGPFNGFAQSVIVNEKETGREVVAYSGGKTWPEYKAEKEAEGLSLRVISSAKFDRLQDDYLQGLKSLPVEVSEARYWEMLEVLPPCRWDNYGGFESFHVSEHLTSDLVSWFFHTGGKYYECTQSDNISREYMYELVRKATS